LRSSRPIDLEWQERVITIRAAARKGKRPTEIAADYQLPVGAVEQVLAPVNQPRQGYVVYMFDKRNYGFSSREKAMDEPATANRPVSRSFLVLRDLAAVVEYIRAKNKIGRVTLIGWSWGAMTAGYYASLHSENVRKLVLYAPLYNYPFHTNLGAGSGLQDKRTPSQFNYGMRAYRLGTAEANNKRWDGEIPVQNKEEYREPGVQAAFNQAALARGRAGQSALAWLLAAGVFVIFVAAPTIANQVTRVEVGYSIAALVLCTLLGLSYRLGPRAGRVTSPGPRPVSNPGPGS